MKTLDKSIVTFTGRRFWPLDPNPEDINPLDIAHALSNICRFTGHVREFYSVADHSCRVSDVVSKENRLWALIHDASEAYMADLASPLKSAKELSAFKEAEDKLMEAVCIRFDLDPIMPKEVKEADYTLFLTEIRDLMPREIVDQYTPNGYVPLKQMIRPLNPRQAWSAMIERFEKLGIEVKR